MFTEIILPSVFCLNILYYNYEGTSFMTFVLNSLYPKGNND
jgi:hypothetical protein